MSFSYISHIFNGVSIVLTSRFPCIPHISVRSLDESSSELRHIREIDDCSLTVAFSGSDGILTGYIGIALNVWSGALTRIMEHGHVGSVFSVVCVCITSDDSIDHFPRNGVVGMIEIRSESIYVAIWCLNTQNIEVFHVSLVDLECIRLNELEVSRQCVSSIMDVFFVHRQPSCFWFIIAIEIDTIIIYHIFIRASSPHMIKRFKVECTRLDIHDICRNTYLTEFVTSTFDKVCWNCVESSVCRKFEHLKHIS